MIVTNEKKVQLKSYHQTKFSLLPLTFTVHSHTVARLLFTVTIDFFTVTSIEHIEHASFRFVGE